MRPQLRHVDPAVEVWEADSWRAATPRQGMGIPSYKEVLLRQSCPGHQGGRRTTEDGIAAAEVRQRDPSACRELQNIVEGWKVVKTKRRRPRIPPQLDGSPRQQVERRSLFFRKMKGHCFNCLARDHKVASCRDPTRCWRCHRFGHISSKCLSHRFAQKLRRQEDRCPTDDLSRSTSHGGAVVDDSLIFLERDPPLAACQKWMDPMVLEACLMNQIHEARDVSTMQGVTPSLVVDLSTEDWTKHSQLSVTPLMIRSKAGQQIGHELIKALSNFNLNVALQQSTPTLPHASVEKKAAVVRQEGSQCGGQKPVIRIKPKKTAVKVVRDMLTKKWIFVKEDKHLGSWPLRRVLDTYRKLSRASSIDAIRLAMLMQGIRKLAQAPELRKKKKKVFNHTHVSAITSK